METMTFIQLGRAHLEKGELALAKKQAKALALHWEETQGPSEAEWELASPFLGEILATQTVWSMTQLKPTVMKKLLGEMKTDVKTAEANIEGRLAGFL